MGWRDELRSPSFRGVPFLAEGELEARVGRRTVTHVMPGKDFPAMDDLGEAPTRFRLSMWVIGQQYMAERDALRDAIRTPGPATLIHPTWGKLRVTVEGDAVVRESTAKGGSAEIQIVCVQTNEIDDLAAELDTESPVHKFSGVDDVVAGRTSAGVLGRMLALFNTAFSIVNLPFNVTNAALSELISATSFFVQTVWGTALAPLGTLSQIESLAEVVSPLSTGAPSGDYALNATILAATTAVLMGAFQDELTNGASPAATTTTTVGSATPGPVPVAASSAPDTGPDGGPVPNDGALASAVQSMAVLAGGYVVTPNPSGPIAALLDQTSAAWMQGQSNNAALQLLIRVLTIVAACDAAARIEYPSAQSALATRDALADALDVIILDIQDVELFSQLEDLRAAIMMHLTAIASGLPSVEEFTPLRTLPALVVAHQVHGDATREGEILAANRVPNPARVQGGVALEVLSDGA